MADVATAPNDSSDGRSGTESDDTEEEHKGEACDVLDSDDETVNVDYDNAILKIKNLQKKKKTITGQYNRVLRVKDNNVLKHMQVMEKQKTTIDETKKWHKLTLSDLKTHFKCEKAEYKDNHRMELLIEVAKRKELTSKVMTHQRQEKVDEAEIYKLEKNLEKEKGITTTVRALYAEARNQLDVLTESNKKLVLDAKRLKKTFLDDQTAKFRHHEKMLEMQLSRDNIAYEREKAKKEADDEKTKSALDAKKEHTMLTHTLRQQTKDDDILRWENAKKRKEVEVSKNVGVIAQSLHTKQMRINNGQFDAHQSLDRVSSISKCQID